jgi:hypothetical protein
VLTVFLLSPASCSGTRAQMLLKSQTSPLTARLANGGAPLGEVFAFMSSLYFRGKLAYATTFGRAFVITPGRGLLPADVLIRLEDLRQMASVPVDEAVPAFRDPLVRDAARLRQGIAAEDRVVLLGSVATDNLRRPRRHEPWRPVAAVRADRCPARLRPGAWRGASRPKTPQTAASEVGPACPHPHGPPR